MPDADDVEVLKKELQGLLEKIKGLQATSADKTLQDVCGSMNDAPRIPLRPKRLLRGHISKVSCIDFAADSRHLVSGALDGKLIVWDTWTGNKMKVIPLQSSWVMAVSFAKSGNFVSCGGMDNMCTIYDLSCSGEAKIRRELLGLEGFLSCSRFLDDNVLITGSADSKIITWDLEKGVRLQEFLGHDGDVMSMSMSIDDRTFLTGSVDKSIKLWDVREGRCKQTFWGHESDVNSVYYHKSGFYFGTGSEDKTARLFDIRGDQQIGLYKPPNTNSGFTSCVLSNSGRYIICGSDDSNVHAWDTLKSQHCGTLQGHENRVTSISIPENGMALASASWDFGVRIWN